MSVCLGQEAQALGDDSPASELKPPALSPAAVTLPPPLSGTKLEQDCCVCSFSSGFGPRSPWGLGGGQEQSWVGARVGAHSPLQARQGRERLEDEA